MALIKCSECGKDVSDTAKSCIHCGCPIEKKVVCSECGLETSEANNVCPNCGNKLGTNFSISVNAPKANFGNKKVRKIAIGAIIAVTIIVIICIFSGGTGTKIDMQEVYNAVGCTSTYCEVAGDGSYLEIDSNPYNRDDYSSSLAMDYVKKANIELGFTEALYTRMGKTRALDGTLTEENEYVKASWTYHPDNGFNVVYTLK